MDIEVLLSNAQEAKVGLFCVVAGGSQKPEKGNGTRIPDAIFRRTPRKRSILRAKKTPGACVRVCRTCFFSHRRVLAWSVKKSAGSF